ncbi:PucR-like helix-turn-helix protein [Haloactinospora alba]|uniref:PucR-like helix-turn-helix protein n=2 Tax=Haloactinospora alba TaxID=405555 RepID=A0A543N9T8_9ACTN|nr:PucR-like helix-turn-helix protein [Haloactinospora alba]
MDSESPTSQFQHNPLADMPADLGARLREALAPTSDEIVAEIQSRIPEYARSRDPQYLRVTRTSVERALNAFLGRIGEPHPRVAELHAEFRAVGAGEAHEGRSLDSLQTAMRSAAVIAWRRITMMSETLELSRQQISVLGESAFLFLEEIAAAATEGYNRAKASALDELQRRRGRLLNLLLADDSPNIEAVFDLARAAEWRVPSRISVAVLHNTDPDSAAAPMLPPDTLTDFNRADPCVVVPDPDGPGRLRSLELALRDWRAALGPTVSITEGAASLSRARDTLELMRSGTIGGTGVVRWSDHLVPVMLCSDAELVRAMARNRLAPLYELRPVQRDRMADTLLVWLQVGFNANEVAQRLHVHPQTVRYRLRRLEQLFGEWLRDPDHRFELELVLRARRLLPQLGETPGQEPGAERDPT